MVIFLVEGKNKKIGTASQVVHCIGHFFLHVVINGSYVLLDSSFGILFEIYARRSLLKICPCPIQDHKYFIIRNHFFATGLSRKAGQGLESRLFTESFFIVGSDKVCIVNQLWNFQTHFFWKPTLLHVQWKSWISAIHWILSFSCWSSSLKNIQRQGRNKHTDVHSLSIRKKISELIKNIIKNSCRWRFSSKFWAWKSPALK